MTTRERREARAERLRGWADKRESRSEAAYGASKAIADMIPFGQPILAGHHSQRSDEGRRARMHNSMSASVEHSQKAESMRSKAENIEAAADRAIYSDDPDAADKLRERIAELEAQRDRIKAYNATCRKGSPDPSLLDERQRPRLASLLKVGFAGKGGTMGLTNLSADINRNKKRLEGMS